MSKLHYGVPKWLYKYVQHGRALFGLNGAAWAIYTELVDAPNGRRRNGGSVTTNYKYLTAEIEFRNDLEKGHESQEVVIHELGHVAHAEIDMVVEHMVADLPRDEAEHLNQMYEEAVERFLQVLSRNYVYHSWNGGKRR